MDLEALKSDYINAGKEKMDRERLRGMINANRHPVLKRIKIQLILESSLWACFLAVYYNFFDGHLKSPLWNSLLVIAVVLLLVHNFLGYRIANNPINGPNIRLSLKNYLKRIRKYSIISMITRVMAIIIIFGYFLSSVESYESKHYWSFVFFILLIGIQIYLLKRIWFKRINKIALTNEQLSRD